MTIPTRLNYWRRLFSAYLGRSPSQLSFWHDQPTVEPSFSSDELGKYYMRFTRKASYDDVLDEIGVPMLDYRGAIGPQYNPIAIAQYSLGNHTLWTEINEDNHRSRCLIAGDWLVDNLENNEFGVPVWHHKFDWEYAQTLKNPWYSGLAQGQGISALLRCHEMTGDSKYLDAAKRAFIPLTKDVDEGGVLVEMDSQLWIEEYMVTPPSHILNGFMWALWGVRDYYIATADPAALNLWDRSIQTLEKNLSSFDLGYWSLYDQSATGFPKMIASTFYHRLHIAQLDVMWKLTGQHIFKEFSEKWDLYTCSWVERKKALANKVVFKLLKY